MEHKVNEIITCTIKDETIHLEVIPTKDYLCRGCFFHLNYDDDFCNKFRNIIGQCDKRFRSDNTFVIFKET